MRLARSIVLLVFVMALFAPVSLSQPAEPRSRQVAKFKQAAHRPAESLKTEGFLAPETGITPVEGFETEWRGNNGARVTVDLIRFRQDSEAYELLSRYFATRLAKNPALELTAEYGTSGFAGDGEVALFRGPYFVRVRDVKNGDASDLHACARQVGESLEKGEADIPVLIKHLPQPDEAKKRAVYLHTFDNLNALGLQQPVLSAIETNRNADAAFATYGPSKLLIVEFNTPQLASENDRRIIARIQELWKLGQPAPAAYRRVGNYSVFVFDAPDEQTAKKLIDEVKYEQVVQWLGENPNILKEAEKRYINITLGVLIAVLKASGYALVLCVGLGGLVGALLFSYRRSQHKSDAYSDAGGMLRLNLDDLTNPETNPARLLRERN
ncbi:MAG TPA: hypothetical protein VFR78_17110 [Pyrinomonadaceae bacterium]|nr:hypothetical protein [Pyrinomonadaceae bacterium]